MLCSRLELSASIEKQPLSVLDNRRGGSLSSLALGVRLRRSIPPLFFRLRFSDDVGTRSKDMRSFAFCALGRVGLLEYSGGITLAGVI